MFVSLFYNILIIIMDILRVIYIYIVIQNNYININVCVAQKRMDNLTIYSPQLITSTNESPLNFISSHQQS